MTNLSELVSAFEGLGVPIARIRFLERVSPPYAVYYGAGDSYPRSDDRRDRTIFNYSVYVYMDEYDVGLTHRIEDALNERYIDFRRGGDGYDADRNQVTASFLDIRAYER